MLSMNLSNECLIGMKNEEVIESGREERWKRREIVYMSNNDLNPT